MSNGLDSDMKMEVEQMFNNNKTNKILMILGVLTLLIFIIGGIGKESIVVSNIVSDSVSASSNISEGFGIAMNNVDSLLRDLL